MSRRRHRGPGRLNRRPGRRPRQSAAPAARQEAAAGAPAGTLPAFLQSQALAVAGFSLLCLALLAAAHVDLSGHDYGYFLPKMLDIHRFYLANGLAWQEYTAGLCAGVFQFANPQSMALALPQALASLFGPAFGMAATYVLAAGLAGMGTYACARFWGLGQTPACMAGIAFAFNGFLLARLAIGHLAFYGFGFAPLMAASLLHGLGALRDGRAARAAAFGCLAALLLAALIYGGLGVALVHTLAVAALMLLICGGAGPAWHRAVPYCLLCLAAGLLAAAPKIEASLAMNAHLTRDFYPLPGFGFLDLPGVWWQSLFWMPSEAEVNARLLNNQFHMGWHEIYYGFTPLLPLALALALAFGWKRLAWGAWRQRPLASALVAGGLALALALNLYEPHWNSLLKTLPLIGQFSGMTRFFALFVPAVALLLGWALGPFRLPLWAPLAFAAGLAFLQYHAIEGNLRGGMYYDRVTLNGSIAREGQVAEDRLALHRLLAAWSADAEAPPIREVALETQLGAGGQPSLVHAPYQDHLVAQGKSNAGCYEPLFGYRLEQYRLGSLQAGSIEAEDGQGHLNLKNPACYVYPAQNQCTPGGQFKAGQTASMLALASYGDPGLAVSAARQAANWVGALALLLLAGYLLAYGARAGLNALARRKADGHG